MTSVGDRQDRPAVSVCMAAYNGSEFIDEQVASILSQLAPTDELVIVDDHSTDDTVARIRQIGDPRIRLIESEANRGYTKTFERALRAARGRYIFLSDQDDIWPDGRLARMVEALQTHELVVGNCKHFGGQPGSFQRIRLRSGDSTHYRRNALGVLIGYRLHWGSAMGFRATLLESILPFPEGLSESHDQWIALVGNAEHSVAYLDDDVLLHRLHERNVTPKRARGLEKIFRARVQFLRQIIIARGRAARRERRR